MATNAKNDTYRAAFNQGAGIQQGSGVTAEKLARSENIGPKESQVQPLHKGQNNIHFDEAASRPSIPVNGNAGRA
jgi:hypothetical protein